MSLIDIKDVTLNEQQQEALKLLKEWWINPSKRAHRFELSGAAGTGKTTLIRYFIQEIGLAMTEVLFLAYVGKATLVMQRMGLNARTIHSAITHPKEKLIRDEYGKPIIEDGQKVSTLEFIQKRKEEIDENVKLIIVDEAGMVPQKIGQWLESYNIPIVTLGDLNQLPPVKSEPYFLSNPQIHLSQIMRQAADSPIPYLAALVSQGNFSELRYVHNIADKIFIKHFEDVPDSELMNFDAIIVPFNATREAFNNHIRREIMKHTQPYPMIGDKMISRGNMWDITIGNDIALVNGMVGYVEDIDLDSIRPNKMRIDFRPDFLPEGVCFSDLTIDRKYLDAPYEKRLAWRTYYAKMEYGYALTCHLAQGSQYDNVYIYLAGGCGRREQYIRQWVYTAITRAVDKVTIIID